MKDELKIKTQAYYDLQQIRIQTNNRIKALVRDKRANELEAESLHHWTSDIIETAELRTKADVKDLLEGTAIWEDFLKTVTGIGPCLAGSLYASIEDIARFANVSKLWKYAGQDVKDGSAPRRKKGEKITWDPFLRMTIYKITDSFVKQNPEKCIYRKEYDKKKEYYRELHPEPIDTGKKNKKGQPIYNYTDMHIHNMAKRKAGKLFLEHLWVRWRELEGLSITRPWVIEYGGHGGYIEP